MCHARQAFKHGLDIFLEVEEQSFEILLKSSSGLAIYYYHGHRVNLCLLVKVTKISFPSSFGH